MFDPTKPQAGIPTTRPNESAITQFRFDCRVTLDCEVVSKSQRPDGAWNLIVQVRSRRADLALEDVIYLPFNSTPALRTHEEGHREINERLYQSTAEHAVRAAAEEVASKQQSLVVPTLETALQDATEQLQHRIASTAQRAFAERAERAANHFDAITYHGQSPGDANETIEKAIAGD